MKSIQISRYSKKGHGLGQVDLREAEVVGTVIGDKVLIELGRKKKGKHIGTCLELLQASPDRINPKCSHVGICGGCTWQQKNYKAQLQTKQNQLKQLFPINLKPMIPCDNPWEYRNKMEFSFSQNKEGERFLGLIIARSRGHVLNLEECHLVSPWFIDVLISVRSWWKKSELLAYHMYSDSGSLRTLTIREGKRTGDKMVFLTVSGNHKFFVKNLHLQSFIKAVRFALPNDNPSIFIRIQRIAKGKPTQYYEMHIAGPDFIKELLVVKKKQLSFHISPASFFQPNTMQAEKLYEKALELANPRPTDIIFDLYCGTATLGVTFAPYVKKVIGIELCPYAVCDAKVNVEANKLKNVFILNSDVGKALEGYFETPDLVILDPPRSGLDRVSIKHLLRLFPKKILYISCNPSTQNENIFVLCKEGYMIKYVQGIDQFPHTPHVENIVVLETRSAKKNVKKD